jgi:type I restriction enzyme S subunit
MNRYNSYRDSEVVWIDEIPSHWIKSKFKYESSKLVQYGLNTNSEQYVEKGVRFLRTTDINDFGVISKDGVYIEEDNIPQNYILEKFDFLISRSGTLGRSYLHLSDDLFSFAGYLVRFNFENLTKSKFVFYFTKSKNFFDWISLNTIQSTIGNVNGEKYSNLDIIIPPFQEQEQIVAYLDKKTAIVDTLIASKEQKINLLKEKCTALINHTITKGLDPNVKLKDSGVEWIGEIPAHWIVKKMKYFVRICNGSDFKDFTLEEGGFPVYGSGGVFSRSSKFIYDKTSVLLGRKGSVGKPKIVDEPFWCSDTTYYTKIKENVNPNYFFFLVQQINFDLYTYGSAIPSMTKSVYDEMLFPYPNYQEQQKIVEYLDAHNKEIDELISLELKKIETLKEYRQALISEVVTGKIKVVKD